MLPQRLFAIGQQYHHDPAFMAAISDGSHLPYVFHWSWTSGKAEKLQFARETGMWLVRDECAAGGEDELRRRALAKPLGMQAYGTAAAAAATDVPPTAGSLQACCAAAVVPDGGDPRSQRRAH